MSTEQRPGENIHIHNYLKKKIDHKTHENRKRKGTQYQLNA